jgi:hypothetical protein
VLCNDDPACVALQFVTIDQMIHHCKAVMQGAKRPFVVGDLPFGSYEVSPTQAVTTAFRVVKEAHVCLPTRPLASAQFVAWAHVVNASLSMANRIVSPLHK